MQVGLLSSYIRTIMMDTESVSELIVGLNHLHLLAQTDVVVSEAYCETRQVNFVTWLVDIICVSVVLTACVFTLYIVSENTQNSDS
jgi:hypothetical protein